MDEGKGPDEGLNPRVGCSSRRSHTYVLRHASGGLGFSKPQLVTTNMSDNLQEHVILRFKMRAASAAAGEET